MSLRCKTSLVLAVLVALSGSALAGPALAASPQPPGQARPGSGPPQEQHEALVRLQLPNRAALDRLVASGADIAAQPSSSRTSRDGAVLVDVVASEAQLTRLRAQGARVVQVIAREGDGARHFAQSKAAAKARASSGRRDEAVPEPETRSAALPRWVRSPHRAFSAGAPCSTRNGAGCPRASERWENRCVAGPQRAAVPSV